MRAAKLIVSDNPSRAACRRVVSRDASRPAPRRIDVGCVAANGGDCVTDGSGMVACDAAGSSGRAFCRHSAESCSVSRTKCQQHRIHKL